MSDKRLFLLDGYALIYRAHFAFINRPLINSKGFNTSAVTGFVRTLWDILKNEKPTHIAVAMDMPGPTFRHEMYAPYKANREEQPEDITKSIPYILDILEAFDIPVLQQTGIEADDIIGTLSKIAGEDGYEVYMVTPDKDYGQLVKENVKMYKPSRRGEGVDLWGVKEILEKWDIEHPDQVIDMLGLQGDSSDNIPGVKGVGPKTAAKLLKQYPSIEEIYKHIDDIKGSTQKKLKENKEDALLSKKLATIKIDCEIPYEPDRLLIGEMNRKKLAEIFNELEFRTLKKSILGENQTAQQTTLFDTADTSVDTVHKSESIPAMSKKNMDNTDQEYHLVQSEDVLHKLIDRLKTSSKFCFDTETTSLEAVGAELVGIAFSFQPGEAFYVPFPENQDESHKKLQVFQQIFEQESTIKIGQNLKYDIMILMNYGIQVKGRLEDTMIMHYLLEPELRHNMDYLAESYLNYKPQSIETLIGKKSRKQKQLSMRDVDLEKVYPYACEDADITWQLHAFLSQELYEDQELQKLYDEVEEPLIQVLASMEFQGINLDKDFLDKYAVEMEDIIEKTEKEIYRLSDRHFNIASPKQVGEILFDHLGIPYRWRKTKSGQYSTSEEKLSELSDEHPVVGLILKHRMLRKLLNTYIEPLPKLLNPKSGRIHTHFNQALTSTGRLSSNNPNVQNIPIRTEEGRKIRKAFIPGDSGKRILAADYSQIELRIMAEVSRDEKMMSAFISGQDIHTATAANVFEVPIDEVTKEQRRRAKTVNFSIIYGAGATNLSQQLDISRNEASDLISQYFAQYSGIQKYMNEVVDFARKHGYVKTRMGRKRKLRDINSKSSLARSNAERMAINTPIQGTAADMIKIAMKKVFDSLKDHHFDTKLIMQVHDELVFDVPKNELEEVSPIIERDMRTAISDFEVPILVEIGSGKHWLEAH
jgi:DNA polymerase-1